MAAACHCPMPRAVLTCKPAGVVTATTIPSTSGLGAPYCMLLRCCSLPLLLLAVSRTLFLLLLRCALPLLPWLLQAVRYACPCACLAVLLLLPLLLWLPFCCYCVTAQAEYSASTLLAMAVHGLVLPLPRRAVAELRPGLTACDMGLVPRTCNCAAWRSQWERPLKAAWQQW